MATRRQYPHLDNVGDWNARQSLRLLWDRAADLDERRADLVTAITAQSVTIDRLTARLAAAEKQIAQVRLIASARQETGGDGDLVDPPTSGSFPPGPTPITFPGIGVVQVYASPDVSGWTETGTLGLTFTPGLLTLAISALPAWSAQPINIGGATQAATIWLFRQIGGTWYGAGAERLRPNQSTKVLNTSYLQWPLDWWYNPTLWGPLAVAGVPGENVAMLVTAGSTRLDNRTFFTQRTPILTFTWPADGATLTVP